jgi:hypothetical protein
MLVPDKDTFSPSIPSALSCNSSVISPFFHSCFHKIVALKLAKECNEVLFKLTAEGPSVMHVKLLEERLERIETKQINR